LPYQIGSNRLTISIPSTLLPERYRFTARSGVSGLRDPFNQQLDGNANGTGGDDFTRTFTVNYQLYGQVFEDWNNNGLNDTGEPPIAGQTIWLDLNNSGTLNAGDASTTSNAQGSYSFSGITPGATVLHITPSANMQISTPSGGSKNLVLGANDANARLDLGLYEVQAIYGHAFNDNNRDGIRNSGELGLPNWQVYVDANQNGVYDVGSPQIYSSTAQVAIPDNDAVGITNTLTVAGAPSSIVDLNVTLTISHTYVSDLKIVLTAPNGTQIALVNQRGAANQDLAGVTLDDQATQPISSLAGSPTQGTYRPESPLSAVNQLSGNGDWKLWISDPLAGDSGTLRGWRLTMTSGDSLATTDANGAFRFSNRVLGTHVLRQIRPVGWRATVPLSEMRSLNITNGASLFDNDFGNQIITQEYWFAFLPFVQR
jgi:subtilisin-like proprotein convertase family protein